VVNVIDLTLSPAFLPSRPVPGHESAEGTSKLKVVVERGSAKPKNYSAIEVEHRGPFADEGWLAFLLTHVNM